MLKTTLLLFIAFFTLGCASRGMPGGGPRDTIPPVVLSSTPVASSLNVGAIKVVHIRFSEDMNEASAVNKVYISPPLKTELSWPAADELVLILKKELAPNQTYVITLGRDLSDLRGNKMTSSFQLAFSTGSKIDSGVIAGAVPGLKRKKSAFIFAYPLDPRGRVDIDTTAMYVSQTGKGGRYQINYMRFGIYRLFALDDQNNNLKIDAAFEAIGIPSRDVKIDSMAPSFTGLEFRMTQIDTSKPQIMRLQSFSNRQLRVFLSEEIMRPRLSDITIRDSVSDAKKEVLLVGRDAPRSNNLDVFTEALDSAGVYRFDIAPIRDSVGNVSSHSTLYFTARGKSPADRLKLLKTYPSDSAQNMAPETALKFTFSTPLVQNALQGRLLLVSENGDTVTGRMRRDDEKNFIFYPDKNLMFGSWYNYSLTLTGLKDVMGQVFPDSLYTHSFLVNSMDDYGSLSGSIWATGLGDVSFVITARALKGPYKQRVVAKADHSFQFLFLPEGKYTISAFADVDSNRVFSSGTLFPFCYSEPFTILQDTVSIRKRWETSGLHIDFPASN